MARRTYRYAGRTWPDPRTTRAWRKLKTQVIAEEPICRLGYPGICTIRSTTADHIQPVAQRPDLGMDRANHRGACQPCNEHRNHASRTTPPAPKAAPPPALRFFDPPP